MSWLVEGIRSFIWGLASAILWLADQGYLLVEKLVKIDFISYQNLWIMAGIMMAFLTVFVPLQILLQAAKVQFNAEYRKSFDPVDFLSRILTVGMIIAITFPLIKLVSQFTGEVIGSVSVIVGNTTDQLPSTTIITGHANRDRGEENDEGVWIPHEVVNYTIDEVDINYKEKGDNQYKFFPTITDLFVVGIIGIVTGILLIAIAINASIRVFEFIILVLIAPLPIASYINKESAMLITWVKMIGGIYLSNFIQILIVNIVMTFTGSKMVLDMGVMAQAMLLLGGFLFTLQGVPQIAKLIGADTGAGGALQQIAHLRQASAGMSNTVKNAASAVGGTAMTGAAAATYGAGRLMGGQSISTMKRANSAAIGGNSINNIGGGLTGPPNNSDFKQSENNHIAGSVLYPNMSKPSTTSPQTGNMAGNQQDTSSKAGKSYDGSVAGKLSNRAANAKGIGGFIARGAINATGHMYRKSANRVSNSRAYQMVNSVNKTLNK